MKKGFTLIEMLIYVALTSLVVGALSSFLFWSVRSHANTKITSDVVQAAERSMAVIISEIQGSQGIYKPTSLFATHPGQLSLQTQRYIVLGDGLGYVDFFICGTRICFKKESQLPTALTPQNMEVRNLVFSLLGDGTGFSSVQINLEIAHKSSSVKPEHQAAIILQSTAAVRAPAAGLNN